MEQAGLRDLAMAEIKKVRWVPSWGQARIESMIEKRPDWCISRQRYWGVPIALFMHRETQELHPRTAELIEAVAQRHRAKRDPGLVFTRGQRIARRRS